MPSILGLDPVDRQFEEIYSTKGIGSKSLTINYHLLRHLNVGSIALWLGYVVSASQDSDTAVRGEVNVWNDDGQLICSEMMPRGVTSLCVWGDILITGSLKRLTFWRLKKSTHDIKLKRLKQDKVCILFLVFWEDAVYAETRSKEDGKRSFKVWNPKGKLTLTHHHQEEINHMIVFQGLLWTALSDNNICIWRRVGEGYQVQPFQKLCGHENGVLRLCGWGESRVASASADNTIRVWNLEGKSIYLFKLNNTPTCLCEWLGKLVCATDKEPSKPVTVSMWNWNGTLFQTISMNTNSITTMMVHKDQLWQGSAGYLSVWEDPTNWKSVKLLWVAFKKNNPSTCHLAKLPREIIAYVISFL